MTATVTCAEHGLQQATYSVSTSLRRCATASREGSIGRHRKASRNGPMHGALHASKERRRPVRATGRKKTTTFYRSSFYVGLVMTERKFQTACNGPWECCMAETLKRVLSKG
jgi:hypothetical protein